MDIQLSGEMYWLVLTVGLTGLLWLPYIGNRFKELGPPATHWFPLPDPPPKAAWAERAVRAHNNAIENLMIFAPLAIVVEVTRSHTALTELACAVYFFARLAHYVVGISGAPIPVRTLAFLVGVACQYALVDRLIF